MNADIRTDITDIMEAALAEAQNLLAAYFANPGADDDGNPPSNVSLQWELIEDLSA